MPSKRLFAAAFAAVFSLSFAGAALADGCATIRAACKDAGFVQNGGKDGKGIAGDCVRPLLDGATAPGDGKLALPEVAADDIAACQAEKGGKTAKGDKGKKEKENVTAEELGTQTRVAAGAKPVAALALPAGTKPGPNIVFILVDDFAMNLLTTENDVLAQSMPNVAQMMKDGATFTNYFVTDSLCCPSRSSIFTGMLPHNTGVMTNSAPDGGYVGFMAHDDDAKTFAVALHDGFYATGMMGKYLNGYLPDQHGVPQGWSTWAVGGSAYKNFDYILNDDGTLVAPKPHLTDEISTLGQAFITQAADGPFFLELATFSPHSPYTPPDRYKDLWPDLPYPKTPAYGARPDDNAPQWLKNVTPLEKAEMAKMEEEYRKRVRSDKGIDDMVGAVRKLLVSLGVADNTYVIFTSDNGYHMGEYSMRSGKQTAFETDIHVPLVVVGPGIAAGAKIDQIAMNIDFYPTFVELAGLPANADVDGRSLVGLLHGKPGPWRNLAVVEHENAKDDPDNPDLQDTKAGKPPTYVALRLPDATYVEYDTGEVEYYDLKADPYQLKNIAGTLSAERKKALHDAVEANHSCAGAKECGAAQDLKP